MPTTKYSIQQMDCPTEEQIIRNRLKTIDGVGELEFDLVNRILTVEHSLGKDHTILAALKSVGMGPADEGGDKNRYKNLLVGVALALAIGAEVFHQLTRGNYEGVTIAMSLVAIALGGVPVLKKALISVRTFTLNINFLMALATVGALAIGAWAEAAMVIVLFAIAEMIESHSLDRARDATRSLMDLAPSEALVQGDDGEFYTAMTGDVEVGAVVRVRPGERIPFDGEVVSGHSDVDQSSITGESMPLPKEKGDVVFAGTVNGAGSIDFRVEHTTGDTTLDRIVATVQDAQGKRAPVQRLVDKFARWYTPSVVLLAVLVATVPPLMGEPFREWLYKALVLLVIACPCALVISTPVALVSALTRAAKMGILIKGGMHIETARGVTDVALDKTGTLTEGKPRVVAVETLMEIASEDALRVAAAVEARSEHPVAQAIVAAADRRTTATEFLSVPGRGAEATVQGKRYRIGNHRWIHEHGLCSDELEQKLQRHEEQGRTVVVLWGDRGPVALIAVADALRDSSKLAIEELHKLGIETHLLTGDNATTAAAIAGQAGITNQYAEMLPEDKLEWIDNLVGEGKIIAMVGDGINDTPALARANVGIAMGAAGTDAALETADVALMKDDLSALPRFLRLSRATWSILWQNIIASIAIKAAFIVLDFMGLATLWMAVFADMGVSLMVVFNGMRLLGFEKRR
ncbi:MAG: cadmium-translocating P-type ATPase [Armatimonadetes bacterium]|nr:cadmium-translocating P-type ATPase [Armatimonadota bacterium]